MNLNKHFPKAAAVYLSLISGLSAAGQANADVAAEDNFSLGRQAYMAGNYNGARDCLLNYVKTRANAYQAHYMLGNCYLQLGEPENARLSYALALANKPDKITEQRCQNAMEQIARMKTTAVKPKQSVEPHPSGSKEDSEEEEEKQNEGRKGNSVADIRIKAIEADILAIEKREREEMNRIQAECKEALAAFTDANAHWWRNIETGERRWGITDAQEQSVRAPFDARVEQVRKTAGERIASKRKEIEDLERVSRAK